MNPCVPYLETVCMVSSSPVMIRVLVTMSEMEQARLIREGWTHKKKVILERFSARKIVNFFLKIFQFLLSENYL